MGESLGTGTELGGWSGSRPGRVWRLSGARRSPGGFGKRVGEGVFLVWTPGTLLSHFYHRGGAWMSGMANFGQYGPMELACGLLRETGDGPGGRVSLLDHRGPRYN